MFGLGYFSLVLNLIWQNFNWILANSKDQTSRRLLSFSILMLETSCLRDKQLLLTNSSLDDFLQHYMFPVQFILGVAGNSINLIVLLSKGMRSKVYSFFSYYLYACIKLFTLRVFQYLIWIQRYTLISFASFCNGRQYF